MSLILEALKKAERQHRLGKVPGIDATPVNSASAASRWPMFLLLVLVAMSMLALGVYLGGVGSPRQPAAEERTVAGEMVIVTPDPLAAELPRPEHDASLPAVAQEPLPGMRPPIAKPAQTPMLEAVQPMAAPSPALPEPPPSAPKAIHEMPDGFVDNLPALNIDIHSYDRQPGKRYVLINLQKYREGDYLAEGPRLSEILPDGVVLEHLGERFILPIGNQ